MNTRRWLLVGACAAALFAAGCGKKAPPEDTAARANEVSQFFSAVQDGDAAIVQRLIQAKPYLVNAKDAQGDTALKVAEQKGNDEVADVLRKNGARE